jgi:hypothetical protein
MFENQGFLHLPGVIGPELVRRVKVVFDRAADEHRERWRAEVAEDRAHRAFFDIPNILDRDDCFIDLVDVPGVISVLVGVMGGDIQLNHWWGSWAGTSS